MDVDELTETEQVELMRFLCSFAWADGEVQPGERAVLERVLDGLAMGPETRAEASSWLSAPPNMEGFDFGSIPDKKRGLFLDHAFAVASAHGGLAVEELRHLEMFMGFTKGPG